CMGGTKLSWKKIITTYGLEDARAFHRAQGDAIALVGDLLQGEAIDADRSGEGDIALAHRPSMLAELATEAKFMANAFGSEAKLLSRDELVARGLAGPHFHGGIWTPVGFGLNPWKYVNGLARATAARGVRICAESPVTGWHRET